MANESAAGRDGWIFAQGRKFYHVYKQNFPMEFIYGLTPDDNREWSRNCIDIRTLPKEFLTKPVDIKLTNLPRRSWAKAMRDQLKAHSLAFANAVYHGYDFEAHIAREEEKAEQEYQAMLAKQAEIRAQCIPIDPPPNGEGICLICGRPDEDCPPF